jgi:hypothetical protein
MAGSTVKPGDLLDLKLMPAWVKEPVSRQSYADHPGEDEGAQRHRHPRQGEKGGNRSSQGQARSGQRSRRRDQQRRSGRQPGDRRPSRGLQPPSPPPPPLAVAVQFLPRAPVFENVVAQVKAEALAYSLFFLARSFLEKPQRYEVALKTTEAATLFRLDDIDEVSVDRAFLEANAFRLAREKFYRVDVTEGEVPKGNFAAVARCRLSGTVLGPTNHHDYQRKLRNLYEQRFSRRMSFPEYQRQIEIVTDPAVIEHWKEEARNVTSYVTVREEPPVTFQSVAEAERHFRQNYLPNLVQATSDVVVAGVASRHLADRRLGRHIEQAWSVETRSPSHMMQELAKRFRDAGLYIFRHRRGMLFVSSIRTRPFPHQEQSVSAQVRGILDLIVSSPRIRRKELADKLLGSVDEENEARKLSLAADLRWLINEGFLIEFNDGALDLPRGKTAAGTAEEPGSQLAAADPAAEQPGAVQDDRSPGSAQDAPLAEAPPDPGSPAAPEVQEPTETEPVRSGSETDTSPSRSPH